MQLIAFDEDGNCVGGSFMDYLLPTSLECPSWELGETVTPSPHHPLGLKGVGESATVGSPPAVVNSVIDALTTVRCPARRHAADAGQCVDGDAGHPDADRPGGHMTVRTVAPAGRIPMSRADLDVRATMLRDQGVPFVRARVVLRARGRPRRRPGDEAIIHADGSIEGFVGGTCAETTVRAQSLMLLDSKRATAAADHADRGAGAVADADRHADRAQPLPVGRHPGDLPRPCRAAAVGPGSRRRADRRRP